MSDKQESTNIKYQHTNAAECDAFIGRLRSKARDKGDDVIKVFKHATKGDAHGLDAPAHKTANEKLFDLIINNIAADHLVRTLNNTYQDKGDEALKYIRDCFAAGGNEDKEALANDAYNDG